jgi:PTS system nitrogen regulatory IIA component
MELTIDDVAKCLNVPSTTVERWIRQGRIPIHKSGGNCRFHQKVIEIWASKHNLPFKKPSQDTTTPKETNYDSLSAAIQRGGTYYNINGETVSNVLKSLVDTVEPWSNDFKDTLFEKLMERESLNSTGIGKGIAIPHPRTPMTCETLPPVIVTGFLSVPIDFKAVDDQPVFVLFLLLSSTIKVHLHLLSRLAFCFRNDSFIEFLKTVPSEADLQSRFESIETELDRL